MFSKRNVLTAQTHSMEGLELQNNRYKDLPHMPAKAYKGSLILLVIDRLTQTLKNIKPFYIPVLQSFLFKLMLCHFF